MKKRLIIGVLYGALGITIFQGCAPLGPNFHGIGNAPIPQSWKKKHRGDTAAVTRWWRSFKDPTLNMLVQKAYAQNLDIRSAGLRILQARAMLGITHGYTFPQSQKINAQASSTRTGQGDLASTDLSFDIGWELDLWGKYARGVESAEAALLASVASYDDIVVSVIAETARNYILYRTAQERLMYAKRNVVIQERIAQMTRVQFNSGNVSELDMQQARTQLYTTKTAIPAIELSKRQALNALALLLGSDASEVEKLLRKRDKSRFDSANKFIAMHQGVIQVKNAEGLIDVNIVPQPSLNPHYPIDANLITRRPDIKAAEYLVHAETAKLGIETAALYPSFTLFGSIGYHNSNALGGWLKGNDPLGVTVGPAFSWNIFNYGQIKNKIRMQDALLEERLTAYNRAVLSAVAEVSNALAGYRLTRKQHQENKKALEATVRAFNLSVVQYNDGLVNYQRLLTTVEQLTATQDRFATIKGNVALNAVALYKALGGGWQISRNGRYVSKESLKRMKSRTDWGDMLDGNMTKLPWRIEDE